MISLELIKKINALWHKQQTEGLTEAEKEEQRLARGEYLAAIRAQVRGMLEAIKDPSEEAKQEHADHCSCDRCKH